MPRVVAMPTLDGRGRHGTDDRGAGMTLDDTTAAPSRRDVLRRSALVGGSVVWMAPAVQTLATPAFALGGSPPVEERQLCRYKVSLKWEAPGDDKPAVFEENFTQDSGNCYPPDPNPLVTRSTLVLQSETSTTADLYIDGSPDVFLGSVSVTAGSSAGCWIVDFDLLPCFNVSESSSYFVVKDGGGPDCEAGDQGYLNSSSSTAYTPLSATGDRYEFCGTDGDLSHVGLYLCIDQIGTCVSA